MTLTKYNFLFGYAFFFLFANIVLVGYAGNIINSPFGLITPPSCSLGLVVIDGIFTCFFSYLTFIFNLFAINSTFFILETFLITPFVLILGVMILDWLRGSG